MYAWQLLSECYTKWEKEKGREGGEGEEKRKRRGREGSSSKQT